jgi:outer membrane protein
MKTGSRGLAVLGILCLGSPAGGQQAGAAPPAAPGVVRVSVRDAEQLALKNNPSMSIVQLEALASREVAREAASAFYPTLWASLTAVTEHPNSRITAGGLNNPIIYDRAAGGLGLNQLITDFGRTANLQDSASLKAEAYDERVVATAAQITLAVDRAFYAALQTRAVRDVARQTVAARQAVADRVGALARSKLKSDLDASFADVNLAEANLLLLDAENAEKGSLAALATVLGYGAPPDFELVEDTTPLEAPPIDPEAMIAEAFSKRPELITLDLDARSAETFHIAERDLALPNIRAMGAVGATPFRNEALGPWYGAVGVNVDIPLFNGFLFSARAKESDLRAQAARQRLLDAKNAVARDVRVAWLDNGTAWSRLSVTRQLLKQADLAMDLARARYELGLGSIVELSQAELQQTRAQIAVAEARYQYRLSQAVLRFEVGRP